MASALAGAAGWEAAMLEMVRRSDALVRIEGESVEADREVEEAAAAGVAVYPVRWSDHGIEIALPFVGGGGAGAVVERARGV